MGSPDGADGRLQMQSRMDRQETNTRQKTNIGLSIVDGPVTTNPSKPGLQPIKTRIIMLSIACNLALIINPSNSPNLVPVPTTAGDAGISKMSSRGTTGKT